MVVDWLRVIFPVSTASMTNSIVMIFVMLAIGKGSCSLKENNTVPVSASIKMAAFALTLN